MESILLHSRGGNFIHFLLFTCRHEPLTFVYSERLNETDLINW